MAYKPNAREYRDFSVNNFQAVESDEPEKRYMVEGYATTFDAPYDFIGDTKECISSRALDGADMSDVIFQYDHQGLVMARMRNNSLSVFPDEHGLHVQADLGGTEQGRQLHEAIKNGLVDRMSWGFMIDEDGWEYDRETKTATITKVAKVYDVSAVSLPANEDTEISARSYLDGVIEQEKQELLLREEEAEMRKRLALSMQITR